MTDIYIGVDIGTSGVKAVLMDNSDKIVGEASSSLTVSQPHPNWSEQDPADWWHATLTALDKLSKNNPELMSKAKAIGLSGQMHGATLLDDDHNVLRPAILWNDGRSGMECAEIEAIFPNARAIAGNIAMAGFTAPKIQWVRKNEPEIFAKIAKVLLPKDYIRFLLTGEFVSEMSDAAGTYWLDVAKRDWSDALLAATGLTRAHMPTLIEGSKISGVLTSKLSERWGINHKVIIAGGAGDNAAAACGIGAVRPGEGFVSLGTSGVLFVSNDKFSPNTKGAVHAFCHAIPNTWHQMGVILSATDSLNWFAKIAGSTAHDLAQRVEENFKMPAEEIFLPYLSGERTPHNNPNAGGSLVGLSHRSDPTSLAQSIMEGVALAFRDSQRVLSDAGTKIDRLIAVGGGSNSAVWLKMIATNLNMEIHVTQDGDYGGAYGAARLGLCAAQNADPLVICSAPPIKTIIAPDTGLTAAYSDQYARYRALYPAIEETRHE